LGLPNTTRNEACSNLQLCHFSFFEVKKYDASMTSLLAIPHSSAARPDVSAIFKDRVFEVTGDTHFWVHARRQPDTWRIVFFIVIMEGLGR
jgi:hypothetical protein